jgi:hypothetical protein
MAACSNKAINLIKTLAVLQDLGHVDLLVEYLTLSPICLSIVFQVPSRAQHIPVHGPLFDNLN